MQVTAIDAGNMGRGIGHRLLTGGPGKVGRQVPWA